MTDMIVQMARILELHLLSERILRSLESALAQDSLRLTYTDFRALGYILTLGPLTLKQVAEGLTQPKTTTHYIVGKLEAHGYLERTKSRRRGTPVFTVTPVGKQVWTEALTVLLKAPLAVGLQRTPAEDVVRYILTARSVWAQGAGGDEAQSLFGEATILAAAAAEALKRFPKRQAGEEGQGQCS